MVRCLAKKFFSTFIVMGFAVLVFMSTCYGAGITDSYPGYPDTWDGLTTNTIIEIKLDTPVAMIGDPPEPDMEYCVKKCEFSGLDFVFTDVSCDVDVSDDRKTIKLYPNELLGENGLFAYKVIDINFEGGGSEQDFAKYFETGDNPTPTFATQIDEIDMCEDDGDLSALKGWCVRCHTDWKPFIDCTITP